MVRANISQGTRAMTCDQHGKREQPWRCSSLKIMPIQNAGGSQQPLRATRMLIIDVGVALIVSKQKMLQL